MASAQAFIDGIEAATLECPLCMERFKTPKILPCIHSFCLSCLEEWTKKTDGILSCPTCSEVCPVPKGGLLNLRNNIYIIGLLDYVATLEKRSVPICCVCNTQASSFCQNCDELYCKACSNAHTTMKISKHHTLITIRKYMKIDPIERFASKSVYCTDHNMPMQFFCDTCKIPVCVGCTLIEHPTAKSHNIIDIKNAFQTFVKRSTELTIKTDEKLLKFNTIAKSIKEQKELVISKYTKCKVDIERQAEELHQLIRTHKEDQLQRLESFHHKNLKSLDSQLTGVEFTIGNLSSMRDIANSLVSSPNHVMALMSGSDVSKRLEEQLTTNTTIIMEARVGFEYDHSILCGKIKEYLINISPEKNISPENTKLTIVYKHPPSLRMMLRYSKTHPQDTYITTGNKLGKPVYNMDTKVICFRVNCIVEETKGPEGNNEKFQVLEITDKNNGCYQIDCDTPLKSCILICLIIRECLAYLNTVEFDSSGNCHPSKSESPFTPL